MSVLPVDFLRFTYYYTRMLEEGPRPAPVDVERKGKIAPAKFVISSFELARKEIILHGKTQLDGVRLTFPTQLRHTIPTVRLEDGYVFRIKDNDYAIGWGATMGRQPEFVFLFGKQRASWGAKLDYRDVAYAEAILNQPFEKGVSGSVITDSGTIVVHAKANSRKQGGPELNTWDRDELLTEEGLQETLKVVLKTLGIKPRSKR
jgi:hypothetical protein